MSTRVLNFNISIQLLLLLLSTGTPIRSNVRRSSSNPNVSVATESQSPQTPSRKSPVWNHFTEILFNNVKFNKCNYCPTSYASANGTSNMLRHLGAKHGEKLLEAEPGSLQQTTLTRRLGLATPTQQV